MSTRSFDSAVDSCRPADADPVSLPATALESTAPEYLRDLKYELSEAGKVPAEVHLTVTFAEDCSFATQDVAEEVREYVRAASFLGAGRLAVTVESVADESKVEPALAAVQERARREGVTLSVDGPVTV
ncbi:hypothetical protein [Halorarius halobius]|uniref:hypothetical protein n=1 Tax=Halorarius halobius TaxID=2962671 RepID=UPI0020CD00DB|nr:hypothetical protein [Halorarius halobius]